MKTTGATLALMNNAELSESVYALLRVAGVLLGLTSHVRKVAPADA